MQTRTAVIGGTIALFVAAVFTGWWFMADGDSPPHSPPVATATQPAKHPWSEEVAPTEPRDRYEFVPGSGVVAPVEPEFPPFVAAPPESDDAQATAERIRRNVLYMYDQLYSTEFSAEVLVECSADGRRCRIEAPIRADMSIRMMQARQQGRWSDHDLEGIEFESVQWLTKDGERRVSMVAKAP